MQFLRESIPGHNNTLMGTVCRNLVTFCDPVLEENAAALHCCHLGTDGHCGAQSGRFDVVDFGVHSNRRLSVVESITERGNRRLL